MGTSNLTVKSLGMGNMLKNAGKEREIYMQKIRNMITFTDL